MRRAPVVILLITLASVAAIVSPSVVTTAAEAPTRLSEITSARAVFLTPDGRSLLAVGERELARYDVATGKADGAPVQLGSKQRLVISAAALSADGKRLAAPGAASGMKVLDVETGRDVFNVNPAGAVSACGLSPDGGRLAAGGSKVAVFEVGKMAKPVVLAESSETGKMLQAVAFSPDGSELLVARTTNPSQTFAARTFDAATGQFRQELKTTLRLASVTHAAWSADGKRIAVAGLDGVALFDAATGKFLGGSETKGNWRRVAFAPDGSWFAAFGTGVPKMANGPQHPALAIFDGATGKLTKTLQDPDDLRNVEVIGLAIPKDASRVVTAVRQTTNESVVKVWEAKD